MSEDYPEVSGNLPDPFDLRLGNLKGLPGVTDTKPVVYQEPGRPLMGPGATFIVQTMRQQDRTEEKPSPAAFTVFLQVYTKGEQIRVVLPAKVCDLIARQRDRLTSTAQRAAAKRAAATRKARGIVPNFTRKKGKK